MSDIKLGEISLDPVAEAIVKGVNMKANSKANKEFQKTIDQIKEGTDMPVRFNPNTSEFDKAKKEVEKPIKTPVKLETEDVDLPLLGKTPIKLSIDKDSRTAIKKTLKDAEKASKSLIDSAARTVKKIGSANYLEELTKNEQQSVSNAVAKVKRNNPGISEDRLRTFEQNLILDRRAKKTHETLSENFKLPDSSSKAYGQEMYEAAIAAAKIQAAVKIREELHGNESYTQFLSKNDRSKSYNGNTLKIPGKFIDQIQTGLYEHFGVGKLGTALSSGKNWTGIQDRMAQSIDSFSAGLSIAVNASSKKHITKEFQAKIDSAVKTAVGMSVDNAISHLSGTKGTKESKKALSLLDRKQDGEYEYSVADIYDILRDRTPTGKNATAGEDAVSGINYKGFSDLFAALQVYQRSGSSKLDKNHVKRLSELVSAIVSEFQDSTYNAQTVIDSINTSLDQAQIEAEKVAKEQSKIEDKSKPKKSSSTTPKKKQTGAAKVEHYIPNIEGNSTYAKLANQSYTTKSKEEALQKLSESFETWNDALPDTHEAYGLKYIYRRYMLEAYQMGASIDELSKFSLTDLSNKAPGYFVKMVEKAGEQFKVFADLYDYVASINKSLLKKNTIKNLLDSIAKGQIAAKRKFGESLELTDGGDLIGISENYKPDFVKEFISLQKKRQQDLNKEIARVTGTESNINVLPEYYNSLLKLFEPSTTPKIEEKKIKETAKTKPKKVEESKPKKVKSTPKTEEPKKVEKKAEQKQPNKTEETKEIEEPKLEKKDESVSPVPNRSGYKVIKPPKILKNNSQARDVNGNLLSWDGQDWKIKSNSESDSLWENIPENPSPEFLKRFERVKKFTKNHPELFGPDALPIEFDEEAFLNDFFKTFNDAPPIKFDEEDFGKTMNDGVSVKVPDVSKDIKDGAKQIKQASDTIEKTSKTDQKISDDKKESSDSIKPKTHSSSHSKKGNNQQDDDQDQINTGNDVKKTKKEFTSQYKEAISDVRDLGKAYVSLQNAILNPTGKTYKKSNGKVGSSYEDFIDQQLSDIEKKENRVRSFNKNVHNQNKTNPSQIKDQNIFDSYEKELQDSQLQQSQFDDNLVSLMRSAYEVRNNAQNEILKTIGSPTRKGEINLEKLAKQQERFAKSDYAYNLLSDKVSKRKGNAYQETAVSDIAESSKTDRESILQTNFGTLSQQINDYVSSIERAGRASEQFKSDFGKIQSDLNKNDPSQFKDTESGMKEYLDFMTDIRSRFNSNKDFYENGIGKSTLDYEAIKNKLIKAENYNTKTNEYKSKVSGFQEQWDGIIDSYNSGDIDKMKEAEHAAISLISTMNDFYKESSKSDKYKKTTSKGTLVEDTVGKVQDINDAKQSLKQFTDEMKLTNKVSETIDTSTGKITQKFKDDYSGNIITITSNIDELNNALRTTQKIQSSGSGGSLLGGLKNLVSGNFKSIVGEIGSSVANVQILGQAFQQMKDGFNTFLDFNKGLTNISYTMDMSKEQLSSLGSSAVDMAKDLSMSLDNTMDIYQIYANMNTTSKEIQETAKPTAILSNLSGVDASTAADQVQGILQQFHMLDDGSTTAADASMHVVDVLDKISGNIGMDYAKGIKVISDAVQASGQVAYDAGMSYEQLAAVSAKVAERTREDGSSIGNAMKTIITRISKVGSMPEYAADVSNEDLSQASESLHKVGVEVYNTDGSFRDLDTILSELNSKWDGLTDAQKANISYNVAATRQTSKFKNILEAWTDSMNLANEATTTSGNAEANQEKYMESFSGKIQAIKTQMDEFWLNFYNSDQVSGALDFVQGLTEGFTGLEEAIGPIPTLITAVFSALTVKNAATKGLEFLVGKDGQASGLANAVG
jgi:TP901 family phage tail tape measure protein